MAADNTPSCLFPAALPREAARRCPTGSVRRIGHQGRCHDAPASGRLVYKCATACPIGTGQVHAARSCCEVRKCEVT